MFCGAVLLELLLPGVLLQVVQQPDHVGQPEGLHLQVVHSLLLDDLLDVENGALDQGPNVALVAEGRIQVWSVKQSFDTISNIRLFPSKVPEKYASLTIPDVVGVANHHEHDVRRETGEHLG